MGKSKGSGKAKAKNKFLSEFWRKTLGIMQHPLKGMADKEIGLRDASFMVLLLVLFTMLQKALWNLTTNTPITWAETILPVFVAASLGWGGLAGIFMTIGRIARRTVDFTRLATLTGMAALPLVIATICAVFIIVLKTIFFPASAPAAWLMIQNAVSSIGIALGWPGYLSALALHLGTGMKKTSALIIALVLCLLLLLGWVIPLLAK